MANWQFLQLERAILVLRMVESSWHSLKIEKEGVNVEGPMQPFYFIMTICIALHEGEHGSFVFELSNISFTL